jgi:hypothetical protein
MLSAIVLTYRCNLIHMNVSFTKINWWYKHGRKAKLVKDKCWKHIGTKLPFRYFLNMRTRLVQKIIGLICNNLEVFKNKVLIY